MSVKRDIWNIQEAVSGVLQSDKLLGWQTELGGSWAELVVSVSERRGPTRGMCEFGAGHHPCKIDVVGACSCELAKLAQHLWQADHVSCLLMSWL